MTTTFPNDADGQALQQLVESDNDLSQPMDIDIQIAAPDEETAFQIANAAAAMGYRTEVFFDEDLEDIEEATEPWTCECSRVMLLGYDVIVEAQEKLNQIAKPLSGYVDGWATYGNNDQG